MATRKVNHPVRDHIKGNQIELMIMVMALMFINRAISASIKAGIIYVVSAGNYDHDASMTSRASNPDVVTVSAISDSEGKCGGIGPSLKSNKATDNTFATLNNFGPTATIAAVGVVILSTSLNGGIQ